MVGRVERVEPGGAGPIGETYGPLWTYPLYARIARGRGRLPAPSARCARDMEMHPVTPSSSIELDAVRRA
jgi:hypothetical protein